MFLGQMNVDTGFNDAFIFFLNGDNITFLPIKGQ